MSKEIKSLQTKLLQKEAIIAEKNIEIQGLQDGINKIFATIEPIIVEINGAKGIFKIFKYIKLVGILIDEIWQLGVRLKK